MISARLFKSLIPAVFFTLSIALTSLVVHADDSAARVQKILADTPFIDGHNDLPWGIRVAFGSDVVAAHLEIDHSIQPDPLAPHLMTDIPRLRRGQVGAQFWSVWIPTSIQGAEAVQVTLEQVDIVKRMAAAYPKDLEMAYSASDIRRIHHQHKVASLIGIEGGHQINDSLAVLRQMYDAGARYMTLTHTTNTDWADSATDSPKFLGLTPFGETLVHEMNRIGMLVDISHVSAETMKAVLKTSEAPVMFSHSSARSLVDHPRNVPDDVLALLASNHGIVMVNFYTAYVSAERNQWEADHAAERTRYNSPPYNGLYIGQPERAKAALTAWEQAHPIPVTTLAQVADHLDHLKKVAGVDHIGVGSDFDGMEDTPVGLEGVDRFPALLQELMRRGWSDADIAKVAGGNLLRVLADAERVAAQLSQQRPASPVKFKPTATH